MMGANKSLLTLRLDNNPTIGDEGVVQLCKGLRTNKTLKVLWRLHCLLCNSRAVPNLRAIHIDVTSFRFPLSFSSQYILFWSSIPESGGRARLSWYALYYHMK